MCSTSGTSRDLGIRGQMPGLGFASTMYMTFQVYYRTPAGGTKRVSHGRQTVVVARGSHRLFGPS